MHTITVMVAALHRIKTKDQVAVRAKWAVRDMARTQKARYGHLRATICVPYLATAVNGTEGQGRVRASHSPTKPARAEDDGIEPRVRRGHRLYTRLVTY